MFFALLALAADPTFPILTGTFNMTTGFWQPATAIGPPVFTRTVTWDSDARRGMTYQLDADESFELQVRP